MTKPAKHTFRWTQPHHYTASDGTEGIQQRGHDLWATLQQKQECQSSIPPWKLRRTLILPLPPPAPTPTSFPCQVAMEIYEYDWNKRSLPLDCCYHSQELPCLDSPSPLPAAQSQWLACVETQPWLLPQVRQLSGMSHTPACSVIQARHY